MKQSKKVESSFRPSGVTSLPELPQTKRKREANFAQRIDEWLEANQPPSMAIELKQTASDSFPFANLEQEQLNYLLRIRTNKGVKVRTLGINGQPDYIWCKNMISYVAILYPRMFCLIAPDVYIEESKRSKRRSLTSDRAKAIASVVVE